MLFTDIEGSTALLQRLGTERYAEALDLHRRLLREAFEQHGGYEVDYEGDSFFIAFGSAADAVAAAAESQRALVAAEWPQGLPIRVRIGIHAGEPLAAPPKYVGLDVHKAARIMAAGHGGQVLLSEAVRNALPTPVALRDLGVHRLKDLLQPEPLYQLLTEGLRSEFPALKTLGNRPNNLPVVATPFIGRVHELATVQELLLNEQMHLLTLTGPGGIGKTRLALQAVAEVIDRFRDGVYWVPFASVRDSSLVAATLAQTLGLAENAAESITDTVIRYLAGREMLLVLDNLEHLIDGARGLVTDILSAAPDVRVVATSREALRLSAEQLYDVPPLTLPDDDAETLDAADAVQLFVARARAADPAFSLSDEKAAAVRQIVRCVEGLPLAIELAAARLRSLPPQALAERLVDRFSVLSRGAHDVDERQRTLRATIQWSYDLLSPPERRLFDVLGLFVGGCRLEAAEAVRGSDDFGGDVLDGISSLIDKSLVRQRADADGQPRYWMLETIREFAAASLSKTGNEPVARMRHAEWYRDLVVGIDNRVRSVELRRRLEPEAANVRAALATFGAVGAVKDEVRLAAQIANSWYLRGASADGRALIESALGHGPVSPATRAYALDALATLSCMQGSFEEALKAAEEALASARCAADPRMEAACLGTLGGPRAALVMHLTRA